MKKKAFLLICAVAAAVLAALAVRDYSREKNAGSQLAEVREEVKTEAEPDVEKTEEPEKEPVVIPIDFDGLKAMNPDVYAWITVPGTEVDYPILQSQGEDQDYYLHRGIDGNYDFAGCIYTQATYNTKTFRDRNTVVYGHAMANGTMFQTIKRYMDQSFFDENKEILVYKPDAIYHYYVFAAYLSDDTHILACYNMEDDNAYVEYLKWVFGHEGDLDHVDPGIELTKEDKIITLSTCYDADSQMRYLVQGVLTEIEE